MKILTYPNNLLRKPARFITQEEIKASEFLSCVAEMEKILALEEDGIGLAATQVGWDASVFIFNINEALQKSNITVFINPKVQRVTKETKKDIEGCLSFPELSLTIERPTEVIWTFQNLEGKTFSKLSTDFYARAVQHEIDHLEGRLLIDHATSAQRLKVDKWLKKHDRIE